MSEREEEQRTAAPDGRPEHVQPDWRREFPIDVPQDHYVARRDFTKFMVLTSLAFVVGQFWIAVQSWLRGRQGEPAVRKIAEVNQLPVGGALSFTYPSAQDDCLLLRLDRDTFVAYNQKCTHLSCAVVPRAGQLHCPCHQGCFDATTGRPLAGPPRRPLPRITLEIKEGGIHATGVELRTV